MQEFLTITPGAVYLYAAPHPSRCRGHRYRVERVLIAVPSYQEQVLVQALTGPDEGLWFVTSLWNFSTRYMLENAELASTEPEEKAHA